LNQFLGDLLIVEKAICEAIVDWEFPKIVELFAIGTQLSKKKAGVASRKTYWLHDY
jgi:hypothetical protein